ncbi:MAG: TonB-dependent receptor, partial [Flavobacteriales bacterium]|nr:TonB-dependent receptor [Flavobacteriales bacterium]
MIKTRFQLFFFLLVLFSFTTVLSQSESESLKLFSLLKEFEEKFDCSFSFADNDIKDTYIFKPEKINSLQGAIFYLEKNTPFIYTILSGNIITLTPKQNQILICGQLIDMETNLPVSFASIEGKSHKVISGTGGNFTLLVTAKDELITIQFIGYRTLNFSAKDFLNKPCAIIYLVPKVEPLEEIIFRNFITKGISKNSNGALEVSYNDFGILPGLIEPDVLQTILALPGIISADETVSYLNVRGGTHDQNLILWDGIKMYQSAHFFGMISAFNPYLNEEVTLIKNGTSATFGDGVSSVIAMNTSNKVNKKITASAGINMINADAYIDFPTSKNSSLQIGARRSINNLLETPTYKEYFKKVFQNSELTNGIVNAPLKTEEFLFYDTSLRWLNKLSPKDFIRINFLFTNNNVFFKQEFLANLIQLRVSNLKQTNLGSGIFYERNWNKKLSTSVQIYGSKYRIEATNIDFSNQQQLIQENDVNEYGIKFISEYSMNSNLMLNTGYQFNETGILNFEEINAPFFRKLTKEALLTNSVFSEIQYKSKSNKININVGGRLNYISRFNEAFIEPRISINQKIANYFSLDLLAELKSQTTSQVIDLQTDFLGIENRRWILSNPNDIPIIKSKQISLGLNYSRNGWLLNAEGYFKEVHGITTQSQGFQNQFQFVRTSGSYLVKGVDFLIHKNFNNISGWISYSYADNKYTFEELVPSFFRNNIDINHVVSMGFSYAISDFKVSSGLNWHTGKPTT